MISLADQIWSFELKVYQQHEWLTDCYRMRMDDDCRHGDYLHGVYDLNATSFSIALVFSCFVKFVFFDKHFLLVGIGKSFWMKLHLLFYTFEKSDREKKN